MPLPSTVQWVKTEAVPAGIAIIVSGGIVVWLGPCELFPDVMPWPDPLTVNVHTVNFEAIAKGAQARERGILNAKSG